MAEDRADRRLLMVLASLLALEGMAVVAWWCLLWWAPASRDWFVPSEWDPWPLLGFWLADSIALAIPSLLGGIGLALRWPGIARLLWITSGCWLYATLLCVEAALRLPGGWLGTALMATATGFTIGVAGTVEGGTVNLFRCVSPQRHWFWSAAQTFGQVAFCWLLVLWIWPLAIIEVQQRAFSNVDWLWLPAAAACNVAGWLLFAFGGVMGLISAAYMARIGRGTPLPTACASGLVVVGPYRYVRNPMAVGGISQGIGIGLVLGSVPVVAYALVGAAVWQFWVRPMEENDLLARHGNAYAQYRRSVRCWWPRIHAPHGPAYADE